MKRTITAFTCIGAAAGIIAVTETAVTSAAGTAAATVTVTGTVTVTARP